MKIKASWNKYILKFKQPAGTSRGILKTRPVWYLFLNEGRRCGVGECAPLKGLSLDDFNRIESVLDKVCRDPESFLLADNDLSAFPALRFALETAYMDLKQGNNEKTTDFQAGRSAIKINGLIWMGPKNVMLDQIDKKLADGYKCLKLKIGALDFDAELDILRKIRSRFSASDLEVRVDANGAFKEKDVIYKLNRLAEFDLHSIEQPLKAGQWPLLAEICRKSPIPIALDEELIPLQLKSRKEELLNVINPQFLVLKPSLLGGFAECKEWIQLAQEKKIGWWVTSALESNLGLCHIAKWVSGLDNENFQGLGTGHLYTNNIPTPLYLENGHLKYDPGPVWPGVNEFIKDWLNPEDSIKIMTSGSTGKPKEFMVKKKHMLNSALSTADCFGLKEGDSALLCLPVKFIAGKMMIVRSLVIGLDLTIVPPVSDPLSELDGLFDFTALVPLQLRRCLENGTVKKVRKIIVGGGRLGTDLEVLTQNINTTVFETFGMTETLTHVAYRAVNGSRRADYFTASSGVKFSTDVRGCLIIRAASLNPDPVLTNDLVELISDNQFRWLGRADNMINTGGIKIMPEKVEEKLSGELRPGRYFIGARMDKVLGEKLILVIEGPAYTLNSHSWKKLERFEIPKEVIFLKEFRLTESGKIRRSETLELITDSSGAMGKL
ncbi:MAG: enolase C-terminal domain-like protein [Candidatus Neomarinimicrobiota bacterium]